VSDERGDQSVDSAGAANDTTGHDQITEESEDEYPLNVRSLVFWLIVVCLGLLGTCVFVAIFLALMRGS
jgi:hypothetical protein